MSSWRKRVLGLIFLSLLVLTIVFWGTLVGACSIFILIQGIQAYIFSSYASADLAKTFDENGRNVEGWR